MEAISTAAAVVLVPVAIVIALFVVNIFNRAISDWTTAWFGRITGLTAWVRRARFRERQLVKPAAWTVVYLALLGGLTVGGFAIAMLLAPPDGVDPQVARVSLAIGAALTVLGALLMVRWWRVSAYYLP